METTVLSKSDISFGDVKKAVQDYEKKCADKAIKMKEIEFLSPSEVKIKGKKYELQQNAQMGFLSKFGIQKKTLDVFSPEFQVKMIHERLKERSEQEIFCRFRENTMRAIFTEGYVKLDNSEIVDFLSRKVFNPANPLNGVNVKEYTIKRFLLTDQVMRIDFINDSRLTSVGSLTDGRKDDFNFGFSIANSEVGMHSISVDSFLHRLVCSNGLIAKSQMFSFRSKHSSAANNLTDTFSLKFNKVIDSSLKIFGRLSEMKSYSIEKSDEQFFDEFFANLRAKDKSFYASKEIRNRIVENYKIEQELTGDNYFTLLNAITRTARDSEDAEKKYQLEIVAGNMMN